MGWMSGGRITERSFSLSFLLSSDSHCTVPSTVLLEDQQRLQAWGEEGTSNITSEPAGSTLRVTQVMSLVPSNLHTSMAEKMDYTLLMNPE
jgi:hypothetical protein